MTDVHLSRVTSGRLFFDLFQVSAADYPDLCKAVAVAFSLSPSPTSFAAGLDAVAVDYRRGDLGRRACVGQLVGIHHHFAKALAELPDLDMQGRKV